MKELMLLTFGMACGAFMAKKHCDQKDLEREIAREKARQPHNHWCLRFSDQIIPELGLPVAPLSEHVVLRTLLLAANSGMEFDIHTQTNPRLSERCRIALRCDLVADTAQQLLDMFNTQSRAATYRMAAVHYHAQARAAAARAGN